MNDAHLREQNMAIVNRCIDAINLWDFDTMRGVLAEDAVFEMPFAPAGFERKYVGRDEILAFVETVPGLIDALVEYFDPIRLVIALGGSVEPPG